VLCNSATLSPCEIDAYQIKYNSTVNIKKITARETKIMSNKAGNHSYVIHKLALLTGLSASYEAKQFTGGF